MPESKTKVWILAARPKTLWAAISPVIIGTAMAYEAGQVHWLSAAAAFFGAVLIQIGTNFANDYFDHKKGTDREDRLGPTRVTQAGMVTPSQMKAATITVFSLALLTGVYLVWRGGIPIVVIGLLSILFGVLYTAGKYPLGYIGLGDIFVLIFFGPVAVGGTYYVQTLTINWPVIIAGLAPGLFSVAILTVNNLRDLDSDTTSGKKTLAVRFGRRFTQLEYLLTIVIACLLPAVVYLAVGVKIYSIMTLLVLLAAIPSFKTVFSAQGRILNDVLASTGKLLLLYSAIFSIGWNL
ncbi:MAG: 1,4-dihydroxy-2-naphthoate polyprenyltransferase [Candidatus Zixiibacteriota bacterium]